MCKQLDETWSGCGVATVVASYEVGGADVLVVKVVTVELSKITIVVSSALPGTETVLVDAETAVVDDITRVVLSDAVVGFGDVVAVVETVITVVETLFVGETHVLEVTVVVPTEVLKLSG